MSAAVRAAVILSGGYPSHDTAVTSRELGRISHDVGLSASIHDDAEAALAALGGRRSLLIVNGLWNSMSEGRLTDRRHAYAHGEAAEAHLRDHLSRGLPVLAVHAGLIGFDRSPAWRDAIGVRWNWDTSEHPPLGNISVVPHPHRGCSRAFEVRDELYVGLDVDADAVPIATGQLRDAQGDCAWAGVRGGRRWAAISLGHDGRAYTSPSYRAFLAHILRWLTRSQTPEPEPRQEQS